MALKVLFSGIDGSGKSTSLDLLATRLEDRYRVLRIGNGDPYVYYRGERQRLLGFRFYELVDRLRKLSFKLRVHGLFLVFNFLWKYALAKYSEWFEKTDIIMYESDILLHPAVYVTMHFPFTRRLSPRTRFRIVNALFGSKRGMVIFYLDTDPGRAVARIERRGEAIQSHENREDLTALRREFERVLTAAQQIGLEIVRIKTDDLTLEDVTDEMERSLDEKLSLAF